MSRRMLGEIVQNCYHVPSPRCEGLIFSLVSNNRWGWNGHVPRYLDIAASMGDRPAHQNTNHPATFLVNFLPDSNEDGGNRVDVPRNAVVSLK
jgi:hypothetical protein